MCLAIYKPKGKSVSKTRLQTAFRRNPHGAGFAYAKDGEVVIRKGFFSFNKFWKAYKKVQGTRAMLIHFRWATHGEKTKANCHPFKINSNTAMIHNGVIQRVKVENDGSDTSNFVDRILSPIVNQHPNFIHTVHGQKVINLAIGDSKVVVMDGSGGAVIFNEKKGHWDTDVWYSNHSYQDPKPATAPAWTGSGYYSSSYWGNGKGKVKRKAHSSEIVGFTDSHASNRGKGRSWIDDMEDAVSGKG